MEISSVCKKQTKCGFCGHQDPLVNPNLRVGHMNSGLIIDLANQLRPLGKSLVVQAHRDGDPLDADGLEFFLREFDAHIRSLVTHGERLGERADELIGNCEAITVSIFRADPDQELQVESLRDFLRLKGERLPRVALKVIGDMDDGEIQPYLSLGLPVMRRLLHVSRSNAKYARALPAMPEHGICLDLLHHPSVAWDGRVYICNRLSVNGDGYLGSLYEYTLEEIWNGETRRRWVDLHIHGRRTEVPLCSDCQYYGVPTQ